MTIFFIIIGYWYYSQKAKLKFKKSFRKQEIFNELLRAFGNIKWHPNDVTKGNEGKEILSKYEIDDSGLFIYYNSRYTDDEFEGEYKNVPFKLSETKMVNVYDRNGLDFDVKKYKYKPNSYSFEGIIISFASNKPVKNRTIVATKLDFTRKNQAIYSALTMPIFILGGVRAPRHSSGESLIIFFIIILFVFICSAIYFYLKEKKKEKKEEPLNRVILEDPKFSKRFKVYSSDQVEARYLVTTAFMERLYNLKTAFGSKNIKCSFYSNKLMIAISTKKDLFEICNINKHTKDVIYDLYKELDAIYKMIDYFKLDENTHL